MSDFTPPTLAARTGYSSRQIQRFADRGAIPGAQRTAGGHWRFPASPDLEEWIATAAKSRKAPPLPRDPRAGRRNYVPHLTRLVLVLRDTAGSMSQRRLVALAEDTEQLLRVLVSVRARAGLQLPGQARPRGEYSAGGSR